MWPSLKEAGYPQGEVHITEIGWYNKAGVFTKELPFLWIGDDAFVALAPTYIDAWLWLWREKEIRILLEDAKDPKEPEIERGCYVGTNQLGGMCSSQEFADPEDAIVDIIGYLVENNLIK